ncbi:MAG: ribosome silencing factor [Proteobacteria bacterium]|nr:ribosome silencing factor [Pseudomonadota bacterium]
MKAVSKKSPKSDIASKKPQPKVVAKIVKGKKTGTQASKGKAVGKKAYELPELLREAALKVLDERKAEDIVCIDLRGRSSLADYAMIASGTSARQLGAIANYLLEAFGKLGVKGVRVEGLPQGDWVLIDAGDILIHMFRPEVRTYYQIEDIWSETTG